MLKMRGRDKHSILVPICFVDWMTQRVVPSKDRWQHSIREKVAAFAHIGHFVFQYPNALAYSRQLLLPPSALFTFIDFCAPKILMG
jgi:hypothetical protein